MDLDQVLSKPDIHAARVILAVQPHYDDNDAGAGGALAALVGVSESAVSHHMRGLRQMRLVTARRDGKEVYYRLEDPHLITLFKQGIEHVRDR